MARKRHATIDDDSGIDLTPMLDVVFIMLIFFIVSTSFIREAGIDIRRPQAKAAESKAKSTIMVAIGADGDVWIDRQSVDIRAVRAHIERLRVETPEGGVVIQADQAAQTGTLVKVMDQLKLAGVADISLAANESGG